MVKQKQSRRLEVNQALTMQGRSYLQVLQAPYYSTYYSTRVWRTVLIQLLSGTRTGTKI